MSVYLEVCEDKKYWDGMVIRGEQGSVFHLWDWLKIVEKHTSSKLYPLIAIKGSTPIALYPFFLKRKCAFSPPPYTSVPYLGPIFLEYSSLKEDKRLSYTVDLQKAFDSLIEELKVKYVMINLPRGFSDCRPYKWSGYKIEPIFHYTLDLTDNVWSGFKKEFRENVKRSEKRGLRVEEGGIEELEFVYRSLMDIYNSQGRKSRTTLRYLKDLYKRFHPENMRVFVAKLDGEILQGIVVLTFRDIIQFWIGGAKPKVRGIYPNEFLHWEVMRWGIDGGYSMFEEFGAGTERLAKFKSKYNPKLSICFRVKKSGVLMNIYESIYRSLRNWVRL